MDIMTALFDEEEVSRRYHLRIEREKAEKMVLFVITSDTDSTFDFLAALCCSQMMNTLCTKADDEYGGRLPCDRCFLNCVL